MCNCTKGVILLEHFSSFMTKKSFHVFKASVVEREVMTAFKTHFLELKVMHFHDSLTLK